LEKERILNNHLNLIYITNHPEIADYALRSGADRIMLDLECRGKKSRQGSKTQRPHQICDFRKIRKKIPDGFISVRINPIIYPETKNEVKFLIDNGVDQIILPYFHSVNEVERFLALIDKRTQTCLLVETLDSLSIIDKLVLFSEVNEFYLGLNDLSLELEYNFPFKVLSTGIIDNAMQLLNSLNKKFGFGGIAPAESGLIPGKKILAELIHNRASTVFLSRAFHQCATSVEKLQQKIDLPKEIQRLRQLEKEYIKRSTKKEIEDMVETYKILESV